MNSLKSSIFLIIIIFVLVSPSYNASLADPIVYVSQYSVEEIIPEIALLESESVLEPYFNQNQILDLGLNSKINTSVKLGGGDSYTISSSSYNRTLEIEEPKAFRNLFDLSTVLIPNINNNGNGDLAFQALENNTKLQLSTITSTYSSYLSTILDISITGNEYFELKLDELDFNFNVGDFAFANLVFEFNTFNLVVVFENSQSYVDFGFHQNSTDSVKILNSLFSTVKINISSIVNIHNLIQPNLIKSVSWNVYSNNPYDFTVVFSKLNFIGSMEPKLILNSEPYDLSSHQNILLDPNTSYLIQSTNAYTFTEFRGIIHTHKQIEQPISVKFIQYELYLEGTIILDFPESSSFVDVIFPDEISIDEITSSVLSISYLNNEISFMHSQLVTIYFIGHFAETDEVEYIFNGIAQGKQLKLEIFNPPIIGSIVLGPNNEMGTTTLKNSTVEFFVPSNWSRGEALIITWFENGQFNFITSVLDLHPSKLISVTSYSFNVGERSQIPILMQNLSSLEYKNADNIYSYHNGDLFSVDDKDGIIINPGDFAVGTHSLLVNATYEGLAPLLFELEIIINQFNPEITFSINRNDLHSININFSIQEVLNWSVSSYLIIGGGGTTETFEFWKPEFEIHLINLNLTPEGGQLDLTLYLEDNLGEKHMKIDVPPYENDEHNKNSGRDTSILLGLGIMGLTSGLSFVGYRFVKNNFGTEKISF